MSLPFTRAYVVNELQKNLFRDKIFASLCYVENFSFYDSCLSRFKCCQIFKKDWEKKTDILSKNNNCSTCTTLVHYSIWPRGLSYYFCSYDYLAITNEKNDSFGAYCGRKTGKSVVVTGRRAVFKFHSNNVVQRRGFMLLLTFFKPSKSSIK